MITSQGFKLYPGGAFRLRTQGPSVIRAAMMGILSLLSTVFGRQKGALWLLICTGIIMVLSNVTYLTDLSFQLSFGATLGIILFGKLKIPHRVETQYIASLQQNQSHSSVLSFFWNLIKDDLKTTLSAQVFTTPLLFYTFHRLSLLSPVANVLIGWIIQPITILGLLICASGLIYLPLAYPLAWMTWVLLEYLLIVVTTISSIPFASISW